MEKRKRRLGDRPDGRKLRTIAPMSRLESFLMPKRIGAQNLIQAKVDVTNAYDYIHKKRREGLKGFGMLHLLVAAYTRTITEYPAINRFINGLQVYARNNVEVVMCVKTKMTTEAPDTMVKFYPELTDTAAEVFEKINKVVLENKVPEGEEMQESSFDKTARILNYIPRTLLRIVVWLLKVMDFLGILPKFLLGVSPFHGSIILTSMGSLGIPPVFHHLYNFGNLPVFLAYGTPYSEYVLKANAQTEKRRFVDINISTDERICDGFYFAAAWKYMLGILQNPSVLDTPPESIKEDID